MITYFQHDLLPNPVLFLAIRKSRVAVTEYVSNPTSKMSQGAEMLIENLLAAECAIAVLALE